MKQFKTQVEWGDFNQAKEQHRYLNDLFEWQGIGQNTKQSVADYLAVISSQNGSKVEQSPRFINQSAFSSESRYYEQIIADLHQVPTRESSWHDFFNGLIWLQFPKTKKLLNDLHIEQIQQFGLHPRTLVRNQVTHFDECGMVLVGTDPSAREIVQLLQNHHWQSALYEAKGAWHKILHPLVFGHANLEMLLEPFMSLTGKWLYIECPTLAFTENGMPSPECMASIDLSLYQHILSKHSFASKGPLKPLPLMGIPGWYENQNAEFYQQTAYFRPLRSKNTIAKSP